MRGDNNTPVYNQRADIEGSQIWTPSSPCQLRQRAWEAAFLRFKGQPVCLLINSRFIARMVRAKPGLSLCFTLVPQAASHIPGA